MEKREFTTLIRKERIKGSEEFVLGRISGIQYCVCENEKGYAIGEIEEGYLLTAEFTKKQYDNFANIVSKLYPGLCRFYIINLHSYFRRLKKNLDKRRNEKIKAIEDKVAELETRESE